MAKRTFGNTWWSRQWLASLERVDFENRLPRGAAYTRAGRVSSLEIHPDRSSVEALVDGSVYAPYEVEIRLTPIPSGKAEALVDAMAADPEIVSALLERELSPKTADICAELGIELFPSSWRALHPACSCPDGAHVCKHVAAVVYEISTLIDMRPLTVFLLRGLDLQKALKARGIDLESAVTAKAVPMRALLANTAASGGRFADPPVPDEAAALAELRSVPFSGMPALADTVLKLIPEVLPKTQEKLREAAKTALARTVRLIKNIEKDLQTRLAEGQADQPAPLQEPWTAWLERAAQKAVVLAPPAERPDAGAILRPRAAMVFGENAVFAPELVVAWTPKGKRKPVELRAALDRGEVFERLLMMPAAEARTLPPEIECWRTVAVAASKCLKAGAVIPAAVDAQIKHAAPRLFWVPAVRSTRIAQMVDALSAAASPWTDRLFDRLPSSVLPEGPNRIRRTVILALIAATNALIYRGFYLAQSSRSAKTPEGLVPYLFGQVQLDRLDGRFSDDDFGPLLVSALKAFVLGDAYPWQPVVTAALREGDVLVNYGIIGRGASAADLAAIEAALAHDGLEADLDEAAAANGAAGRTQPKAPESRRLAKLSAKRPVLLKRLLSDPDFVEDRFAALSVLRALEAAWPELAALRTEKKPVHLSAGALKDFLFDAAPMLALLGAAVMLPPSLKHILKPRLVASASAGIKQNAALGKEALSDFDWRIAVGGDVVGKPDAAKIEGLLRQAGSIIRSGEDFVYLDPDEIAQMVKTVETQPQPSYLEKMRAVLTGTCRGAEVDVSTILEARIKALSDVAALPPPKGLKATLRPYQARGFSWLMKNLHLGLGALIADDMGLGKTLQVIAAMLELKNEGELDRRKILAVVPTTLMTNWEREIAKFAPTLTVGRYHGPSRRLPPAGELPDVTLTSYGLMRRDQDVLGKIKWRLLVLDEAQAVKNAGSGQSAAARAIKADQAIAMTGTPVENRLMEYWAILDAVEPRLMGTQKDFAQTFASPIENDHDPEAAAAFKRLTAPFMLRRLKSDKSIIADLPERIVLDQFTTLLPEQASLYEAVLKKHLDELEAFDKEVQANPEKRSGAKIKRSGLILRLITALKQICNSPSQYLGERVERPDSGKAAALLEILSQCRDAERKVLVFTQFREMGERLQDWIEAAAGERPDFLHGGVSVADRQAMVDRFQTDRSVRTLIVSLKAGGTGLNLTAASAVVHYDLWWNPAVEAQATDRAYRIGQQRDVLVYRFVTAGTFEEKINEMLQSKRELADLTVASGEAWIGELSSKELGELFRLAHDA